jgi:hypothetical protein
MFASEATVNPMVYLSSPCRRRRWLKAMEYRESGVSLENKADTSLFLDVCLELNVTLTERPSRDRHAGIGFFERAPLEGMLGSVTHCCGSAYKFRPAAANFSSRGNRKSKVRQRRCSCVLLQAYRKKQNDRERAVLDASSGEPPVNRHVPGYHQVAAAVGSESASSRL